MGGRSAASILPALLGLGLSLSAAGLVQAQSLGDAARREQEKKKGKPAVAAPAFTDEDLKSGRTHTDGTVSEMEGPVASPTASPSPAASAAPEPDRRVLERQWRQRFAAARARIAQAEALSWEERVETVFVAGIPVQQRVRVKVETPELQRARQAHADLEEELRRTGLPPGWGRE
jgi:hypothetical protein